MQAAHYSLLGAVSAVVGGQAYVPESVWGVLVCSMVDGRKVGQSVLVVLGCGVRPHMSVSAAVAVAVNVAAVAAAAVAAAVAHTVRWQNGAARVQEDEGEDSCVH